ncbi:MAG: hypothetical protein P8N02_06335 [Actinomycetota bacterium]|nr:hypothetical protein [Actinomycetota bacterium]
MRCRAAIFTIFSIVLASCAADARDDVAVADPEGPAVTAAEAPSPSLATGPSSDETPAGRILVLDSTSGDAPLTVRTPSGDLVAALPTTPGAAVWHPTWTPDNGHVVWAE